ncbi:MAG: 30S ribosomal protein S3 [Bacilli bacterium]
MGQKVNPVGMRIGINRDWSTRWFANDKDFSTYLLEDLKIRQFLTKELKDALLSHVEIERVKSDKGHIVSILIFVARPGVVIGQDGARINLLKKTLAKLVKTGIVKIDVIEVKNPNLDANLVAQMIAKSLEERVSFRIAQKKAIQLVKKSGAKGIKTEVSGRLGGAEIARSEGYKDGIVPLHTLKSDIDYALAEAATTYGKLGVKVWICRGEYATKPKKVVKEGE